MIVDIERVNCSSFLLQEKPKKIIPQNKISCKCLNVSGFQFDGVLLILRTGTC